MYEYHNRAKISVGRDAAENMLFEMKGARLVRPMLITERMNEFPRFAGRIFRACDACRTKLAYVAELKEEKANDETLAALALKYRENNCDCIIAAGRAAVISTAKVLALMVKRNLKEVGDIRDTAGERVPLYVVSVITASGDEASDTAKIYGDGAVKEFKGGALVPDIVAIDDKTVFNPHRRSVATGAFYALARAISVLVADGVDPMSRAMAESALRLVRSAGDLMRNGVRNKSLLRTVAAAKVISGSAYNAVDNDPLAVMSREMCRRSNAKYEKMYAMLFPHYFEYLCEKGGENIEKLLIPLAGEDIYVYTPSNKRAYAVYALIREMINDTEKMTGFRYNLSDFGVKFESLETCVSATAALVEDEELARRVIERTY